MRLIDIRVSLIGITATLTACAGAPAAAPGPVAIQSSGMEGPNTQVAFHDGRYQGVIEHGVVDLRTEDHELLGVIGSKRIQLHVSEEEDVVVARGTYENELGELRIENLHIAGRLGQCRYDLARADGKSAYAGEVCCSASGLCQPHTTKELHPGREWETLSPERRVAVVALALESRGRM